ncbi:hypothetical protein KC332_g17241 [Hortaea werneckii]|uniref:HAUS augmin-like complex subunit 6 N-terminal domain-containing protein n=1 Tax=Hortaea werneckii EXF-2000 TaxID=1157616 RepID=A0A1Z5TDQ2_HORWE|nr:hypothetical protein KC358_g16752 [Hortaea werneckii]OTA34165.1 hypothetical protein BTJ68_06338 [Hortaea werneckii EXF-2000]KAI6797923.1 hypothetical protein KC350_g16484 [Hortaea werneckii]KAI6898267.1 hypothetical protein KC348_g17497 [Hortaea werneckii]KAI6920340.1 hypothetical protein KC341_g16655 [Hortaea werneckii]
MERPMSRDHAPSTTSTPRGHTRNPSSTATATKSATHSLISLFATNLRLLGLDTHPDCPALLALHTFTNPSDSRTRIRTAEFALYHLFRIYHPATAADKLRPFYPPLEPLQSVNLRAALFRCLDTLKKNGVLGRETVLRKSMLDECQGEKFWELCLAFSALVLRKSVLEREQKGADEFGVPIAERLGTASGLRRSEKDVLTPLAIAHRVSLSRGLEERERKKQAFARLYDVLVEKEAELARRKEKVQQTASGLADQVASVEGVEQSVKKGWHGNRELQKVLINGDTAAGADAVLTRPLHKLTATDKETNATDRGLLENLSYSATRQQHRVRKWQSMHESLLAKWQPTSIPATIPEEGTKAGNLRFDKHHHLSIREVPLPPPSSPNRLPPPPSRQDSVVSRYDDILTSMREELRQRNRRNGGGTLSSSRSPERPPAPSSTSSFSRRQSLVARKPSIQIDTAAGALSQQQQDPHQRSASETAVPMRPSMARRASSRSRSYQQPKVEGMRQPIPLKSELFSPLKAGGSGGGSSRRGSAASPSPFLAAAGESMVASPVQEREEQGIGGNSGGLGNDVEQGFREGRVSSQSTGEAHQKIDSAVGLGIDSGSVLKPNEKTGEMGPESLSNDVEDAEGAGAERISVPDRESKIPPLPSKRASEEEETRHYPPISPRRGTLADRTLASLSGNRGSQEAARSRPSSSSSTSSPTKPNDLIVVETPAEEPLPPPTSTETPSPNPSTPAPLARHTSLSDRARQTMAMGPPPSAAANNNNSLIEVAFQAEEADLDDDHLAQETFSRLPRTTAATTGQEEAAGKRRTRRDLTPRENLFSPDAHMDSVFKARPRVAVSPVGNSPFREAGGDDEQEEEEEGMGLGSSPLGGR